MDIKCPVCRRKLGHVVRPEAKGRFFCTACDLWVAFTKKDAKISYRLQRPGR
ncbi:MULTISPECIES: hypothetical protein [Megamonas]|uniref:hypothetical protein n=1 Tax=Megamonas TaxID=158846 RepID=UPI00258F93E2|nr:MULTISPECIES: hypothetical protein [Megamonas]MDY3875459.1 hypothetical protein [Megamonas funiformis]